MDEKRWKQLERLTQNWIISDMDLPLLNQALTHPSYTYEHSNKSNVLHNQRLEFLGDAILGIIAAEFLYLCFSESPEGVLTKTRAAVVCETNLAQTARQMDLGQYLLLGRGEELSGGRERPSILADAFEAVLGAVYLAKGWETVKKFALGYLQEKLSQAEKNQPGDYKTALQEMVQRKGDLPIRYEIIHESGPDHHKCFRAGIYYQGLILGEGEGRTKKEAEQQAARTVLERPDCLSQLISNK